MTRNENRRSIGRAVAIPMIGLGAACCALIEFVQGQWPEFAALPAAAGSTCALFGILLLFRSQVQQKRAEQAQKAACIRISPYVPEMADGTNGADALRIVLAPASQSVHTALRTQRPLPEDLAEPAPAVLVPFFEADMPRTTQQGAPQRSGTSAALISALRLGSEWSRDVKLSGRAQARLESDPFVRRLARLG